MKRLLDLQAKRFFLRLLSDIRGGFLEIVCSAETYSFGDPSEPLRAMAVIHDDRFFFRALTGSDIGMGESFADGDWTSPDLVALVRLIVRNLRLFDSRNTFVQAFRRLVALFRHRLRDNTIRGSRRNIEAHYDLGNEFYRLFLDRQMVYSSAYFLDPEDTLDLAQQQKLDLICRKLRIEPGDRVLEIGCGWGAFALHAARHYGARVTGVTISRAQYDFAVQRAAAAGLPDGQVTFLLDDYRRVRGRFDKVVSIEMFEAVGFRHYDDFFGACDRLLDGDGTIFVQTITVPDREFPSYRKRVDWIQTYIFPGSELASLVEIGRSVARATRLCLVDMESLGIHYARTLACWRQRFLGSSEVLDRMGFAERFQRMWDFYLAWCEGGFRERYINVVQLVLAKDGTQRALPGDPLGERQLRERAPQTEGPHRGTSDENSSVRTPKLIPMQNCQDAGTSAGRLPPLELDET